MFSYLVGLWPGLDHGAVTRATQGCSGIIYIRRQRKSARERTRNGQTCELNYFSKCTSVLTILTFPRSSHCICIQQYQISLGLAPHWQSRCCGGHSTRLVTCEIHAERGVHAFQRFQVFVFKRFHIVRTCNRTFSKRQHIAQLIAQRPTDKVSPDRTSRWNGKICAMRK